MRIIPTTPQDLSPSGRVLVWMTTILLWGTLFTPLIISSETLFPFQAGKGFAYRVLIELAAFFYVWLCIIEPKTRPKPSPLFWSVVVFAGILLLTTIASTNVHHSFWGDLERMEGVFGILHGIALFVIAYGLFTRTEDWTRFFSVSLSASLFVSLYAFAQLDPSFRFFPVFEPKDVQPGSTFGHHSFVATYAIFQIFFGLFVAVTQKSNLWRIFALSASAVNLILFMLAAVRGAQVGMIAALGIGIALALVFIAKNPKARIAFAGTLIAGVAFFAGTLALKDSPLMKKMPYGIQRMSSISSEAWTARTRLISLQISWEVFKERPLVGWGQENFKVGYNKHFDPRHLNYEQTWFDRAHNKVAEVAVQSGIVGLLSYVAMFLVAFVGMIRHLKSRETRVEQTLSLGVIMLGTAYFMQNLFLFDTTTSYLLLFSSLAFTGFLIRKNERFEAQLHQTRLPVRFTPMVRVVVLAVAGILTLILIVRCNWIPYTTARLGRTAVDATNPHQALLMLEQAKESAGFPTAEATAAVTEAVISSGASKQEEWSNVVRSIEQYYNTLPPSELTDARILIRLGKLYNDRGAKNPQYLSKSEQVLRRAIELAPARPEGYQELGVNCLLRGEGERGLGLFREALALNENNSRSRWVLGLALASQKKFTEGLIELEKAMSAGYNWDNPADIRNLSYIYDSLNMTDKLVQFYKLVVDRHPENAGYRNTLAGINRMLEKTADRKRVQ